MTVSLRPYRAADDDVVLRWIDDPVITVEGEATSGTRDDWEDARTAWNSTG